MFNPSARTVKMRIVGNAPILPQPNLPSNSGYSARKMMNVTRNALRKTLPADCPLRLSPKNWLRAFGCFFTKDSSRLEDQDHDQQREHHRLGPARVDDTVGNGGRQADDHAAQEGALDVADAAHDGRGKAVQAIAEALEEPGRVVVQPVDRAGRAGHGATDQEREGDG